MKNNKNKPNNKFEAFLSWPAPEVSPNFRYGWEKSEARKEERTVGFYEAELSKDGFESFEGNASMLLEFFPKKNHIRDLDNLLSSMKHRIDGICDSLKINDCQIKSVTLKLKDARPKNPGIHIVIKKSN